MPSPALPMRIAEFGIGDGRAGHQPSLVALPPQLLRQRIAASGPDPTPTRSVGVAFSCDTWAARSNAWLWNVTLSLHSVPACLHDIGQDVLAHGLGDHVVGGVGDRAGRRSGMFFSLSVFITLLEHVAFVRRVAQRVGERLGQLRRRRGHRHRSRCRRVRRPETPRGTRSELNGPMIAITLSSSASLRRPTTACSGLPAVSNETILSFLPLTPPAALISSTAICAAISLVLARVAKGPAPAKQICRAEFPAPAAV